MALPRGEIQQCQPIPICRAERLIKIVRNGVGRGLVGLGVESGYC